MVFEICFNKLGYYNDEFLIDKLGAYRVPSGSAKYPPFEILNIEIIDFEHLKEILDIVDKEFGGFSDAIISYDPPTLFLDVDDIYLKLK
jgi:hypothetical protein